MGASLEKKKEKEKVTLVGKHLESQSKAINQMETMEKLRIRLTELQDQLSFFAQQSKEQKGATMSADTNCT